MGTCKIYQLVLGPVQTNCYLVTEPELHSAIVIDPADRGGYIKQCLDDLGVNLEAILLTHGHFDHIGGVKELKALTGAKVYALEEEKRTLSDPGVNLTAMNGRPETLEADVWLKDRERIRTGAFELETIWTPGHTVGGTCYYLEKENVLFSGDTLFQQSVGRTDFPGGSMEELISSVRSRLWILPDDVAVCPGHGDGTTIGYEKQHNLYLRA